MKCAKCDMEAKGWKCAICGSESEEHDPDHKHGEPASDRQCMPKCSGCNQAEPCVHVKPYGTSALFLQKCNTISNGVIFVILLV